MPGQSTCSPGGRCSSGASAQRFISSCHLVGSRYHPIEGPPIHRGAARTHRGPCNIVRIEMGGVRQANIFTFTEQRLKRSDVEPCRTAPAPRAWEMRRQTRPCGPGSEDTRFTCAVGRYHQHASPLAGLVPSPCASRAWIGGDWRLRLKK